MATAGKSKLTGVFHLFVFHLIILFILLPTCRGNDKPELPQVCLEYCEKIRGDKSKGFTHKCGKNDGMECKGLCDGQCRDHCENSGWNYELEFHCPAEPEPSSGPKSKPWYLEYLGLIIPVSIFVLLLIISVIVRCCFASRFRNRRNRAPFGAVQSVGPAGGGAFISSGPPVGMMGPSPSQGGGAAGLQGVGGSEVNSTLGGGGSVGAEGEATINRV